MSFLNRITAFISEIRSFQAKRELQQLGELNHPVEDNTLIDLDRLEGDDSTLGSLTAMIKQKNKALCEAEQAMLSKTPKERKDLISKVKALDLELQVLTSKRRIEQERILATSKTDQPTPLLDRKDCENRLEEEEAPGSKEKSQLPGAVSSVGDVQTSQSRTDENNPIVQEEAQGEDQESVIAPA